MGDEGHLLALLLELLSCRDSEVELCSGGQDNGVRGTLAAVHDVSTLGATLDGGAGQVGHCLS